MRMFCFSEHSTNLETALLTAINGLIRIRDTNRNGPQLLKVAQVAEDTLQQISTLVNTPRKG